MWAARKLFWNQIAISKFRANRPATIPVPRDDDRKLGVVSLASQFPSIPVTAAHRRCVPALVLPAEYEGPVDLGSVAVAGPYACYLERAREGGYHWDLRGLASHEHCPGGSAAI